jgi:MFS family permease
VNIITSNSGDACQCLRKMAAPGVQPDSPSTAFRYHTQSKTCDYGTTLGNNERANSAPSELQGGLFVLRPKVWRYWMAGVLSYAFAICLENVIIFPSIWPRLKTFCGKEYDAASLQYYLGAILGSFSAGRAISAIVLNLREHTRQSMRVAGTLTFLLSLAASILYTFAWSPKILLISRGLAGLGAGALTLLMTTLVTATSDHNRTSAIANFFIAAALGEIVGPLLAFLTASLEFQIGDLRFDHYNSVGMWTFLVFLLTFPWALRGFTSSSPMVTQENILYGRSKFFRWFPLHLFSLDMFLLLIMALINNAAVSSWETLIIVLGDQYFGWDVQMNSIVFIISGFLLFFSNIFLVKITSYAKLNDDVGVWCSIVISCAGSLLLYWESHTIHFFALGNIAYSVGIFCLLTFLSSMYTKTIVARGGFFIGVLRASSAGVRVLGNAFAAMTLVHTSSPYDPCSQEPVSKRTNASSTNASSTNASSDQAIDPTSTHGPQMLLAAYPFSMLIIALLRTIILHSRHCERKENPNSGLLIDSEDYSDEDGDDEIDFALTFRRSKTMTWDERKERGKTKFFRVVS